MIRIKLPYFGVTLLALLFSLFPGLTWSDSEEEKRFQIIERSFSPLFDEYMKTSLEARKTYQVRIKGLPDELQPEVLLNDSQFRKGFSEYLFSDLDYSQLVELESLLKTSVGKQFLEYISKSFFNKEYRNRELEANLDRMLDADPQLKARFESESSPFSVLMSQPDRDLADSIMNAPTKAIEAYYSKHDFGASDSSACAKTMETKLRPYYTAVCEAGYSAGDFDSSMILARQYWSADGRERNIPKAKSIYKEILKKDTKGEAHYFLGMLIKNSPDQGETQKDAYCTLLSSFDIGYKQAAAVLNEFGEDVKNENCK